jgi:D-alanyl-D-alanine carboxypeptidase/D-alanyl-D-alanine-endopeptidase (penicillin-binding protein 4)
MQTFTQRTLLLLFCFLSLKSQAQKKTAIPADKLAASVQQFAADPALKAASVGFCISEAGSGKLLYDYHSGTSLIPASTFKIVTTGAALGLLGEDFRFRTILEYDGNIDKDGTLSGNIYLRGGGDPTLGYARVKGALSLDSLISFFSEAIAAKGIRHIAGNIIADGSYFEEDLVPDSWAWNDMGNYYGAGASGLNAHENMYELYVQPGTAVDSPVKLGETDPPIPGLIFQSNELLTGEAGSGDNSCIFGEPYSFSRKIKGTVPTGRKNFKVKGSLPDPPAFLAATLAETLKKAGIGGSYQGVNLRLLKDKTLSDTASRTRITTLYSPPLKDIVYQTNLKSINLYAECMLRQCGRQKYGTGSTKVGVRTVTAFWKEKGLDTLGLFMQDGSGLSHYDAISAAQLMQILNLIGKQPYFEAFYNSLPVAGESGAMAPMGKGSVIAGRMHAKSGHMDRVRSYAGYIKARDGRLLSFALIVNNYACSSEEIKRKIEQLLIAIGGK